MHTYKRPIHRYAIDGLSSEVFIVNKHIFHEHHLSVIRHCPIKPEHIDRVREHIIQAKWLDVEIFEAK